MSVQDWLWLCWEKIEKVSKDIADLNWQIHELDDRLYEFECEAKMSKKKPMTKAMKSTKPHGKSEKETKLKPGANAKKRWSQTEVGVKATRHIQKPMKETMQW